MSERSRAPFFRMMALAVLMAVIIAAFLGVGELALRTIDGDKTVVLDPSLFQEAAGEGLRIDTIIKRHVDSPMKEAKLLDGDQILFHATGSGETNDPTALAVYSIDNNQIRDIVHNQPILSSSLSPDGTRLIYSSVQGGKDIITVWYDLVNDKTIDIWDGYSYWATLLNDNRYIDLSGYGYKSEIRMYDLKTGPKKYKTIAMINDSIYAKYAQSIDKSIEYQKKMAAKTLKPMLSPGGHYLSIQLMMTSGLSAIHTIKLDDDTASDTVEMEIYEFTTLRDGRLLISGRIDGVEGLYLASGGDAPVLLKEGMFSNLAASSQMDAVSYLTRTGDERPKLLAGKLDGNRLTSEITVYGDPGYVGLLQWSSDGKALICTAEGLEGTEVYKFQFAS